MSNTEQKLKDSEERYRELANSLPQVICEMNERGNLTFINANAYSVYGYTPDDFNKGLNAIQMVIPEDRKRAMENMKRILRRKEEDIIGDNEYTALRKDGSTFPVFIYSSPIVYKDKSVGMRSIIIDITDQKKAEQKLKDSEEKYRKQNVFLNNILESLTHPFYVINVKDYTIALANSTASSEGFEHGQYCYSLSHNNIKPCEAPCVCPLNEVKNTKKPCVVEHKHYDKEGNEQFYEIYGYPILDERGNVVQMIEYALNISDRKIAQQELKESEEKYRLISETAYDLIGVLNKKFEYEYINETAFQQILGYSSEDLLGKSALQFTHPEDISSTAKALFDGFKQGKGGAELRFKHKDGHWVWIEARGRIFFDKDRDSKAIIISRDITRRKQAERELQHERDNFLNILDSMEDGVYILNQQYDIEYVNPSLSKEFGQFEGMKCFKYFEDRNEICPRCKNREVFQGKTVRGEWFSFKNQKTYDLIDTPLKNPDGSISKLTIMRDETDKKQAEVKLKESEENLRVSNENLKKTLEELKSSNKELEQFAFIASHDLQEPLRMVSGFANLLEKRYRESLDEEAHDFIDFIIDGTTRMHNLINDLLTFSRIGTRGKVFKPTDMNVVLEATLNNIRISAIETNAIITNDPLPVIIADKSQMVQLLQNLISNAIKFHGPVPPKIHITGEVKKDEWIFTVRDNGIGIDSKNFERIFVIFQRLHKKGEFPGTGIGLTVCKRIIQLHGGKIWVESELKKGSIFHFSIPRNQNEVSTNKKVLYSN